MVTAAFASRPTGTGRSYPTRRRRTRIKSQSPGLWSVSDPDNNFVSGAGVTIRETQTGLERKLQTDGNGQFRAAALPVGTYTVEAVAAGFGVARIGNLTLAVGETKDLNITCGSLRCRPNYSSVKVPMSTTAQTRP